MPPQTRIHLHNACFTDKEMIFAEHGELSAGLFCYPSGVCVLTPEETRREEMLVEQVLDGRK